MNSTTADLLHSNSKFRLEIEELKMMIESKDRIIEAFEAYVLKLPYTDQPAPPSLQYLFEKQIGKWRNPEDGSEYEGEMIRGVPNGACIRTFRSGIHDVATYIDGKAHGKVKRTAPRTESYPGHTVECSSFMGLSTGMCTVVFETGKVRKGPIEQGLAIGVHKTTTAEEGTVRFSEYSGHKQNGLMVTFKAQRRQVDVAEFNEGKSVQRGYGVFKHYVDVLGEGFTDTNDNSEVGMEDRN